MDLHSLLRTESGRYQYEMWKRKAIEKVSVNGLILKYESDWWTLNRDIVAAAINQNPFAIKYAPAFQDDKELALMAVRANGLAKCWLSPKLQRDDDIQSIARQTLPLEHCSQVPGNRIFLPPLERCPPINYLTNIENSIYHNPCNINLEKNTTSRFIRDSRITLFSGKQLLPYPIDNPLIHDLLMTIIPQSASHFFLEEGNKMIRRQSLMGKGFKECNIEQAMITAYDFNLSFKRGKTCIEGGNCFLFISNRQKKAIVGELSLYLSMIALEEQGLFKEIIVDVKEPSLESYRIARNIEIYNKVRKPLEEKTRLQKSHESQSVSRNFDRFDQISLVVSCVESSKVDTVLTLKESEDELSYRQLLVSPINQEDKIKYLDEAKKIEAKLMLTKNYIANELELKSENIVFIPQTQFHLDMEMFVTPTGEVVLHDDFKALEFLDEMKSDLDAEEEELFKDYQKAALEKAYSLQSIQQIRQEILSNFELKLCFLPLIFEASTKSALNYCNGIFVKNGRKFSGKISDEDYFYGSQLLEGFSFITTGPSMESENIFHKRFLEVFRKALPDISLIPIPNMSQFLAMYHGGIHCMTFAESIL